MSRAAWLALLFGVLLVSHAQLARADDDYEEDEEEDKPEEAASDGAVVTVTAKNFDDTVKNKKFALVAFTAPWCGHCKSLKPEWAKAAAALKEIDPDLTVGNVDATIEKDLATEYGVQGYPTIKFFVDGKESDYSGGRQSDEIVKWVKKKTGPPAQRLESADKIKELLEGGDAFVLGYFDKFEGDEYEAFVSAARQVDDVEVLETTAKAVAKEVKLSKPGYAAVRKAFGEWEYVSGEKHAALKGEGERPEQIAAFFKAETVAPYLPYSSESHQKIFGSDFQDYIFVFGNEEQIAKAEKDVLKPTVGTYRGKALVVSIDMGNQATQGIVNYFMGENKPEELAVMAWNKPGGKKFKGPEKVDKKSFDAFAKAVVDKTAEPFFKSEAVPEDPVDEDGITKVVGKSFGDLVLDPTKDVLLEVYAPWCGHCKSFLPTYKKLAKRFKKIDSMVIAQFDGTANEHEALQVQGFPTIKFYPAGENKEAMAYEGERNLKDLTKFLKKHAKVPFELPKKGKKAAAEDEEAPKDEL